MLVACGNPLLDISITVDDGYLKKHELDADTAILAEDKHMEM
jgi:adenosine kinase